MSKKLTREQLAENFYKWYKKEKGFYIQGNLYKVIDFFYSQIGQEEGHVEGCPAPEKGSNFCTCHQTERKIPEKIAVYTRGDGLATSEEIIAEKINEIISYLTLPRGEEERKLYKIQDNGYGSNPRFSAVPNDSPQPRESWEEELKRQCENRGISFKEVKYLVDEVLSSEKERIVERVMKLPSMQGYGDRKVLRAQIINAIKE